MCFGIWLKPELADPKRKLAVKLSMVAELRFSLLLVFFFVAFALLAQHADHRQIANH